MPASRTSAACVADLCYTCADDLCHRGVETRSATVCCCAIFSDLRLSDERYQRSLQTDLHTMCTRARCASDVDNTALKLLPVIPHAPKDPKNIVLPRHCQQTQCDYGMGGVTNKSSSTGPHAVAWHTPRAGRRPDAVPGCKTFPYRDIATKRHATITIPFEARWSG